MAFVNPWRRTEVAVDFGTSNMRLIRLREGVVFDEPSLCCFTRQGGTASLVAAGSEAQRMIDRTPPNMVVRRPLRRGVLQDIESAREMLRYGLARAANGKRLDTARGIFGVPADATEAERGALLTAAREAGFKSAQLITEPFLAAVGAGLPIDKPVGTMIIECGAGTTEVAIISLGRICITRSVRGGGAAIDKAIGDHLHTQHKFLIGDATAEALKYAYVDNRTAGAGGAASLTVKGRCLTSGLPGSIEIPLSELDHVVEKQVRQIVDVVRDVLIETPPELSRDIHDHGVLLTGGSSVMPLLSTMIGEATGLPVSVAQDPARCVANGLHAMLG